MTTLNSEVYEDRRVIECLLAGRQIFAVRKIESAARTINREFFLYWNGNVFTEFCNASVYSAHDKTMLDRRGMSGITDGEWVELSNIDHDHKCIC